MGCLPDWFAMPEIPIPQPRYHARPPAAGVASADYAELEVTTNFSFLRGASHPDEMVYRAAELGHRAIAITDFSSLAGVVRAYEAHKQVAAHGPAPKLIIGTRLSFTDFPSLLVWATDRASYGRLCRLLTLGKRRAEKGSCLLVLDDFLQAQDGLLAAVANRHEYPFIHPAGELPQHALGELRDAMGDRLSLAISRLYGATDQQQTDAVLRVSRQFDIPLLATNSVYYHDPARRILQDVVSCIRHLVPIQQAGYRLFPNGERYIKPPAVMQRLFADLPRALRRGIEIADRCDFSLGQLRYEYPRELAPVGMTSIAYLTQLAWEGADGRYPQGVPQRVRDLIVYELNLIGQLHYEAYFLTVYDIVRFARSRGILCQGRGSAANSAVCYCIGITSVDPSRSDMLFERFISAARGEPPDIDVDFEHERREEVLQYIYDKFGRERTGMTAEIISYRGRSAVRDVGKALGLPLDLVDQMAGHLEGWSAGSIADEQLVELGLDPQNPHIRRVIDVTGQILGFPRHLSQHVGGMIMTQTPLCEMVPIENAAMAGRTVIEWDKNDIDALGILKVDCLALGMLTCLSKAMQMINARRVRDDRDGIDVARVGASDQTPPAASAPLELHTIPPEDPAVFDMICKADTVGVFQIESRAQMSMLPRLKPRCFYDLVIEVAIVRPGPIQGNMVHPYLRRRGGLEAVVYPSEALRAVLHKTLGVPLFQEQAMKIAMVGAGFTAEESDLLRRAMAAWRRHGSIERFYQRFIDGMLGNGYTPEFAEQCFLQIRGFGEYGFPESHAASFALLVYASAWIKHHHPAEFAAALINSQPMGFYAPAQIVRDAKKHGVEILPIDVNHSDWDCTLVDGAIRLGMRLIKGLPSAAAEQLVAARHRHGRFASIQELQRQSALSRSHLQKLAEADAYSSMQLKRREAIWHVMELSDEDYPLFDSLMGQPSTPTVPFVTSAPLIPISRMLPPMPMGQEVMTDYATTSLSLKRHPVSLIRAQLDAMKIVPAGRLVDLRPERWVKVAGLVLIRQRPATASGIVFETLEDESGIANIIIRPEIFDRYRAAARHATLLEVDGYIERSGQVIHIMAKRLVDLSHLIGELQSKSRDFH